MNLTDQQKKCNQVTLAVKWATVDDGIKFSQVYNENVPSFCFAFLLIGVRSHH